MIFNDDQNYYFLLFLLKLSFSLKNILQENTNDLHQNCHRDFFLNLRELTIQLFSNSYKQAVKAVFILCSSPAFLSDSTVALTVIKIAQALQNIYKVAPVGGFLVLKSTLISRLGNMMNNLPGVCTAETACNLLNQKEKQRNTYVIQ